MSEEIEDLILGLRAEGGFFSAFEEADARRTAAWFRRVAFPEGSRLTGTEAGAGMLGFLLSGDVVVEEKTELKGNWIAISRLGRGALLASPMLFGVRPVAVRAQVLKDAELVVMDREAFESFLEREPVLGVRMLQAIIHVLMLRLRKMAGRLASVF